MSINSLSRRGLLLGGAVVFVALAGAPIPALLGSGPAFAKGSDDGRGTADDSGRHGKHHDQTSSEDGSDDDGSDDDSADDHGGMDDDDADDDHGMDDDDSDDDGVATETHGKHHNRHGGKSHDRDHHGGHGRHGGRDGRRG